MMASMETAGTGYAVAMVGSDRRAGGDGGQPVDRGGAPCHAG